MKLNWIQLGFLLFITIKNIFNGQLFWAQVYYIIFYDNERNKLGTNFEYLYITNKQKDDFYFLWIYRN